MSGTVRGILKKRCSEQHTLESSPTNCAALDSARAPRQSHCSDEVPPSISFPRSSAQPRPHDDSWPMVKLLIQPQDGVAALLSAIKKAKSTIEIVIFRFDRAEIETALTAAVRRGVSVSALIAYANRGGEQHLRRLEMRLLAAGVNVSRTPAKLVRYHNKMMIVDGPRCCSCCRSISRTWISTTAAPSASSPEDETRRRGEETLRGRQSAQSRTGPVSIHFVVSPANARRQLAALILGRRRSC